MPRRTLLELFSATQAIQRRRNVAARRVSRAERMAKAPKPPHAALLAYSSVMDTYAERVAAKAERLIFSRIEGGDIEAGLARFELELRDLASNMQRSSRAAARRASKHARREVERVLNVALPRDLREDLAVERFVQRAEARLLAAAQEQTARIRQALIEGKGVEGARKALWVSRLRSQAVARDEVYGLQADALRQWATETGSTHYIWVTARDERVRASHSALDGKVFAWAEPPVTGAREGANHPGEAPNCRCRALPVEATYE